MPEKDKNKKPKGKKGFLLGVIIGLPLIGGGVFGGLAFAGIVKIPGITPKSKLASNLYGEAAGLYGEAESLYLESPELEVNVEPTPPPVVVKPSEPEAPVEVPTDPEAGAKKLAKLWNALETSQLLAITKEYKDPELAMVMSKMETEASANLLAAL
ncbi:MAG: hypothetical protein KF812_02340, partial [Fimbriimonadaceae bacterium]|nr:hypothetical protein [Fimbriimonadaceae bacterium]